MIGLATPRCEFKVTVEVRWFLDVEQAAELLRAMAAADAECFFTAEEVNRVVDWIAREREIQTFIALNSMSAVGGEGTAPVPERKPELVSADFNRRLARALRRERGASEAEEKTRAILRVIFGKSVEAVDRTQTP